LIDLVKNAINSDKEFQQFKNKATNCSVTYGGVQNAISFNINATATSGTLQIPSANLVKAFNGSNSHDLEKSVEDFLKKNGSSYYTDLMKTVNKQSSVGVTDGNPDSVTAKTAEFLFRAYGSLTVPMPNERANPSDYPLIGDVGVFHTKGYAGTVYSLPIDFDIRLCDNVRLGINIPLSYSTIEKANIFDIGLGLSVPIRIFNSFTGKASAATSGSSECPFTWQITPSGGAFAAGSYELLSGGIVSYGGLTNMVAYSFPGVTVSMGNQLTYFQGDPLTISSYTLDSGVSNWLLKNGVEASVPLSSWIVVNTYATYSNFLQPAAVAAWWTVGVDFAIRPFGSSCTTVNLGFYTDLAEHYDSEVGRIGFGWRF